MKYAYVINGVVAELFEPLIAAVDMLGPNDSGALAVLVPAGDEVPLALRFHPSIAAMMHSAPAEQVVSVGDSFDGDAFGPPPEPPPPTVEQVVAQRAAWRAVADAAIAPLQDAVDLGVETGDEVALLTDWKQYRVDLNRIEQQPGFPADVEWPVAPA